MNKSEIEKLAQGLVSLIDRQERDFADWLKRNDKRITNAIISVYEKAPTAKDGYIDKRAINKFIALVPRRLKKALGETGYFKRVQEYLANFDKIAQQNATLLNKVGGYNSADLLKLASPLQKRITNIVLTNLVGTNLANMFIQPVNDSLLRLATIGTTLTDTVNSIRGAIVGQSQYSKFANYALTAGRDALSQYDGALNQKIADEFGLNAVVYVGTVVENSRAQCIRWLGRDFIPISELQGEIDWAFNNGSGMIPATTPDTFVLYRGGFSCRHKAVPILVTEEQIEEYKQTYG